MVTIIDIPWLEQHLADPRLKIVDPRSTIKYLGGHIPGAVSLPVLKVLDQKSLELKGEELLAEEFGGIGIDADTTVVLYDGFDGQNSAMLAWVLEYLGHERVKILSSFLEAWSQEGRELLYRPIKPDRTRFQTRPNPAVRATLHDVEKIKVGKLVDLRSPEEFNGELTSEARAGHLPGAINLPWNRLLGAGNEFLRSRSELEETARASGLVSAEEIVTYCNYGPRAAVGYVALQQLGYENVRVYDGSFHQWALHPELTVEGRGSRASPKAPIAEWASYVLPGC